MDEVRSSSHTAAGALTLRPLRELELLLLLSSPVLQVLQNLEEVYNNPAEVRMR